MSLERLHLKHKYVIKPKARIKEEIKPIIVVHSSHLNCQFANNKAISHEQEALNNQQLNI